MCGSVDGSSGNSSDPIQYCSDEFASKDFTSHFTEGCGRQRNRVDPFGLWSCVIRNVHGTRPVSAEYTVRQRHSPCQRALTPGAVSDRQQTALTISDTIQALVQLHVFDNNNKPHLVEMLGQLWVLVLLNSTSKL